MSTEFARLTENLPVRRKPTKDSFPTQAKSVKQWIEALPLANSGATAKMLYNGLKELNTLEVDPLQRLETLELMRHPIQFTLGGMDKHVIGQALPLPQQKRQIGQVMRDFHRELALGYKLAVVDICGPKGGVPFLRGRYVLLAVVRSMEHIGALLGKCYLTYSEISPGCWSELHALFAYAATQGLLEKLEKDPQVQGVAISPMSCYVQAMLMFLSNPYRLTQKEIVDLEAATRVWSAYILLRLDGSGEGVFVIDPDQDHAPGVRVNSDARRVWRLDCAGLVSHIKTQLETTVGRDGLLVPRSRLGQSAPLTSELVERLLLAWGFGGERAHQRMPAGHILDVVIGLQGAHYLVGGSKDFNAFVNALSVHGVNLSDRERAAAWAQASSESAKPLVTQVEVQDQSLGGYRIYWASAANLRARVGELIAVSTVVDEGDEDPRDWMIGVMRWLRGGNTDSLEAGVQLISRQAEAVAVRATTEGRNKVLHRGLLLAPLDHEAGAPTLLSNTLLDQNHPSELLRLPDPYGLSESGGVVGLTELKMLENTGSYKLFGYALEGQSAEPAGAEALIRPTELESIWSTV